MTVYLVVKVLVVAWSIVGLIYAAAWAGNRVERLVERRQRRYLDRAGE